MHTEHGVAADGEITPAMALPSSSRSISVCSK
jgi:hypothetical protein